MEETGKTHGIAVYSINGHGGMPPRKPSFPAGVELLNDESHPSTDKEIAMQERKGVITFKGNPMTLLGPEIKVGDKAPDFRVVDTGLAPVTLADFKGKVKIISAVPSLDTPTCDTETRRFNQEAAKLPGNVVVLTVSLDLPFAQKRWCAAAGIDKVKILSDYQDRSFASAFGVLIKELKLLSRSIFVIDGSDTVRYVQHVKEVSQEPDYAAALAAARDLH
jgi:thioredoxin-dependent peroxiredoxin